MKTEIFYTICDPMMTGMKAPMKPRKRQHRYIKEGAPSAPVVRFSIRFGVRLIDEESGAQDLHSWRFDGNLIVYNPATDSCNWVPARTFYGGANKHLVHPNERARWFVARALGDPKANEGYDTITCACAEGADCAACRVEKGWYMKLLESARAWRKEWTWEEAIVTPELPAKKPRARSAVVEKEKTISEEIGSYITGED